MKTATLREWLVAMSDEGLSPATVAVARRELHACLQRAVDDGVGRNPVDRTVEAPGLTVPEFERVPDRPPGATALT